MAKVLASSIAVSAAIVALAYVVVMTVPTPLTNLFSLTGYLVGEVLVPFIPDSVLKELASQHGGPLVAASALGTWFLIVWVPCVYLVWRLRSNNMPHTDARGSGVADQPPSARAGERER
jgi:glycerol-3-phosphate acyltransferase PlsY